jgi:hypothetical protein
MCEQRIDTSGEVEHEGFHRCFNTFGYIALRGWSTADKQASPPTELYPEARLAQGTEEITGRWHTFPHTLLLQFNEDGSAQFDLDWDGKPIGYQAMIYFEGQDIT